MNREMMWRQVLVRDPSAGFFYAVSSTGVFCRPSCPSRRPAVDRVNFYSRAADAIAAGYRPCRRCAPLGEGPEIEMASAVCRHLAENLDRAVNLVELGRLVKRSPFTVQRVFVRTLGVSPKQYHQQLRMNTFREELVSGSDVTSAMVGSGYSSPSRLYEKAAKTLGMTPKRFRDGGREETIHVAVSRCALGLVQVAATSRGLCSVMLGDRREELKSELERQFPKAQISTGGAEPYLKDVLRRIAGGEAERGKALPIDVRATAFQALVWKELEKIPRGETRSYAGVARALGRPRAVRAVARACALNQVAIVVPCHRVVGSDGALTGYRWGIDRKRKLLEMERDPL